MLSANNLLSKLRTQTSSFMELLTTPSIGLPCATGKFAKLVGGALGSIFTGALTKGIPIFCNKYEEENANNIGTQTVISASKTGVATDIVTDNVAPLPRKWTMEGYFSGSHTQDLVKSALALSSGQMIEVLTQKYSNAVLILMVKSYLRFLRTNRSPFYFCTRDGETVPCLIEKCTFIDEPDNEEALHVNITLQEYCVLAVSNDVISLVTANVPSIGSLFGSAKALSAMSSVLFMNLGAVNPFEAIKGLTAACLEDEGRRFVKDNFAKFTGIGEEELEGIFGGGDDDEAEDTVTVVEEEKLDPDDYDQETVLPLPMTTATEDVTKLKALDGNSLLYLGDTTDEWLNSHLYSVTIEKRRIYWWKCLDDGTGTTQRLFSTQRYALPNIDAGYLYDYDSAKCSVDIKFVKHRYDAVYDNVYAANVYNPSGDYAFSYDGTEEVLVLERPTCFTSLPVSVVTYKDLGSIETAKSNVQSYDIPSTENNMDYSTVEDEDAMNSISQALDMPVNEVISLLQNKLRKSAYVVEDIFAGISYQDDEGTTQYSDAVTASTQAGDVTLTLTIRKGLVTKEVMKDDGSTMVSDIWHCAMDATVGSDTQHYAFILAYNSVLFNNDDFSLMFISEDLPSTSELTFEQMDNASKLSVIAKTKLIITR